MNNELKMKLDHGQRLDHADGLELLSGAVPLGELMQYGYQARLRHNPENVVTFVYDSNPNYTNVCVTKCEFCAFWRSDKSKDAYTLSPQALAARVATAAQAGATTVLLQGGHNPDCSLDDWMAYIEAIQTTSPDIHIHPFSPPEIAFLADQEGRSSWSILERIVAAGIRTMPGGGAEILTDRVRNAIAPEKCSAARWLEIMEEAHGLGMKTTATMMYGHVETPAEIIDHLLALRDVQDRSGGFSSFIPWSFKPGNSTLGKHLKQAAHPLMYLRIISVARLLLDNIAHVQSSWFSEDLRTGQLGLLAGADNFWRLTI
jgi:cyclic dehypoxanthinyl futalosine synthase